jgi:hypothetical protein
VRKSIVQQDDFGYGAACVAFAAKVSYGLVIKILGQDKAKKLAFIARSLLLL